MSIRPLLTALAVVAALLSPPLHAAPPGAVFTIVDGEATVVRGAVRFPAEEGLRIEPHDIVHTADTARLVRIEVTDGSVLDLGDATQLLLRPAPRARAPVRHAGSAAPERAAQVFVAQGWTKVTPPVGGAPATLALASRHLDLPWVIGTVVMHTTPEDAVVFVEAGTIQVTELRRKGAARTHTLAPGHLFSNRGGETLVSPRPVPELLAGMPRAFADSLPLRAARFAHAPVEPTAAADITYDDVAGWINHPDRRLRLQLRNRWAARAQDPAFRARLVAERAQHPEWDRVLFPERFQPRRTGAAAAGPPRPATSPPRAPTRAGIEPSASLPAPADVTPAAAASAPARATPSAAATPPATPAAPEAAPDAAAPGAAPPASWPAPASRHPAQPASEPGATP